VLTYGVLTAVVLGGGLAVGGLTQFLVSIPVVLVGLVLGTRLERWLAPSPAERAPDPGVQRGDRDQHSAPEVKRFGRGLLIAAGFFAVQAVVFTALGETSVALALGASAAVFLCAGGVATVVLHSASRPDGGRGSGDS
jgi:hypothetical protein